MNRARPFYIKRYSHFWRELSPSAAQLSLLLMGRGWSLYRNSRAILLIGTVITREDAATVELVVEVKGLNQLIAPRD